ncbi:leucyl aminopeptidase [Sphingosinicella sp. LY1275]|uniref:leucyl aminopeptidase n=1 Tax=Sphingosinicella sp. LY1275 TaxID=3095379 RepID=UPI002ADEB12B|nr:leucyl aminopeptidase [Sphingosinicella sp. LY1275]MEA1014652.1 leucyl aminopeptidase [Sphingosinicella sp. LY1275]
MRLFAAASLFLAATALTPAQAARPIAFAPAAQPAGALVLPLGSLEDLASRGASLDAASRDAVGRALQAASFDYAKGSTLGLRGIGPYAQLVVVGTGTAPLDAAALQDLGGTAARETAKNDGPVAFVATGLPADAPVQIALGAALGSYSFDRYKSSDPKKPRNAGHDAPLTIVTADAGAEARYRRDGRAMAEGVAFTRDLITEPANVIYPESFVERTREAFKGVPGVTIEALDVAAMEKLGMGSILAVGKGSQRPPRMLLVHYKGASGAPVALAGKGITFDSGGISLKPGTGMWYMKDDMSGAATVVGTVLSLAKAGAPVNVVAIAALAENMPGGAATRPGDVVKAHNGKTIEIINTDAEGRLVLADAVAYAERRFRPAAIVDVATLTGSVVGALGDEYAGLFSRHDALADQLAAAGRTSGEALWRLPLHENHASDMKSDIADIKNSAEGGGPGASLGAHFIGYFVDSTPWAHLDIAGTAWRKEAQPTVPKGAAGWGVRLLDRFVRDFRAVPAAASAAGN